MKIAQLEADKEGLTGQVAHLNNELKVQQEMLGDQISSLVTQHRKDDQDRKQKEAALKQEVEEACAAGEQKAHSDVVTERHRHNKEFEEERRAQDEQKARYTAALHELEATTNSLRGQVAAAGKENLLKDGTIGKLEGKVAELERQLAQTRGGGERGAGSNAVG
jgi:chromosome segregation ATPase